MNVLFDRNDKPFAPKDIRKSIEDFGHGYNQVIQRLIENSDRRLDERVFCDNIATLMPNFKMTRNGPFRGVRIVGGAVQDPKWHHRSLLERGWQKCNGPSRVS